MNEKLPGILPLSDSADQAESYFIALANKLSLSMVTIRAGYETDLKKKYRFIGDLKICPKS